MASNPAFNRLEKDARSGYAAFEPRGGATQQAWGGQQGYPQQGFPQQGYGQPGYGGPAQTDPRGWQTDPFQRGAGVTMDDVIMKTLGLFAIVLVTGAGGWFVAAMSPGLGFMLWMGGMIATLVLGLVIAFKKTLSVPLILLYAVVEGVFVGAVSQFFETRWPGIVMTAVLATLATFAGMFIAYKVGLIKVTNKFRRIMSMFLIGYAIFAVVNFGFAMLTNTPFGIGGTSMLGLGISLFAVGLAALTLALDFDAIDYAISSGAPKQYSWLLAHGLIVTLVWLYIEFLRLFARLRE